MYQIDAAIRSPDQVECTYDHLCAGLFVARAWF